MKKCDYCGEYKKVRKIFEYFPFVFYNFICENCDQAKKIILERERKIEKEKKLKEQKEWIIQRDIILSNIK